jgi:hypothetical protein
MHRFGIEEETWFESARTGLEQRGFRLRVQTRSIIIDKEGRLPRIVGGAREFLEFAERQGIKVDPAAWDSADRYGDARSDLRGRYSASPFETPPLASAAAAAAAPAVAPVAASAGYAAERSEVAALEARLKELRAEQEKVAQERREAQTLLFEKRQLETRVAELAAEKASLAEEMTRLQLAASEAVKQCDLWKLSAAAAEERLRALQAEADRPAPKGIDKRFDQLRRFLARELHPDLAGDDNSERLLREALFKRVWAKVEQLQ